MTYIRRLGARKDFSDGATKPGLRFAVWAPNAKEVEVVFGTPETGYIADDGDGIDPRRPPIPLSRGADGIWQSRSFPVRGLRRRPLHVSHQERAGPDRFPHRSLLAIRSAAEAPTRRWPLYGHPSTLDGTKGCSLIRGLDSVAGTSPIGR